MNYISALTIIKTYPFIDVENLSGEVVRKHLPTEGIDVELLRSYSDLYSGIKIIPKKIMGNAPVRLPAEGFNLMPSETTKALNGFDASPIQGNSSSDLYKILYEQAKDESREYKNKYENVRDEKQKLEILLAEKKNDKFTATANSLAGILPSLLGGGLSPAVPAVGVGEAPQDTQPQDVRLRGIIAVYSKLPEANKQKIYNLLNKVFTVPNLIDKLLNIANNGEGQN